MDGGSTEDAGGGSFASLGGVEGWRASLTIATWCLVFCGSIILNATLLVAFIRRPGLRTISNRFVMNLIASNVLMIFILSGLLIANSSGVYLPLESAPSVCALSEGATALVTTSSILSVLLIGLDQYLAVVDPLRYRTRIDKLKCSLLIVAVWLISLVFAALATLNPSPQSLWQFCQDEPAAAGAFELGYPTEMPRPTNVEADFLITASATKLEIESQFSVGSNEDESTSEASLSNTAGNATTSITYGLIFSLIYTLLGYLAPFVAMCWIYVSIYMAARNNSERTRRTGSRPMLSSGSFSEEAGAVASTDDLRRIPKISSLSSIDENSEACPSQISVPPPQMLNEQQHQPPQAVVFTLGANSTNKLSKHEEDRDDIHRVVVAAENEAADHDKDAKDSTECKVPIITHHHHHHHHHHQLHHHDHHEEDDEDEIKSSRDLMYERMMLGCAKHPYEYDDELDESSDEDEVDEDEEDCEMRRHCDEEAAMPLSSVDKVDAAQGSTRSISVNFATVESQYENARHGEHGVQQSHHVTPPIVTITPPGQKPTLHRVPSVKSTHSYIHNLKYRISNGSLFKYREETRAARISALVIVMGLICWTPYFYVLMSKNVMPLSKVAAENSSTATLDITALCFLIVATYVSPLLFGYRSKRVKRELRKFFCFKQELSYKNNRSLMAKKVLRRRHSGATILGQFVGCEHVDHSKYSIFNFYGKNNKWPKEKVHFVQVPDTALAVETCRSSFSSGASTQISSTSTDEC